MNILSVLTTEFYQNIKFMEFGNCTQHSFAQATDAQIMCREKHGRYPWTQVASPAMSRRARHCFAVGARWSSLRVNSKKYEISHWRAFKIFAKLLVKFKRDNQR